jgi:hypothetical protein
VYKKLDDDALKVQSVLDAIQILHSYYLKKDTQETTAPTVNNTKSEVK